MRTRFAPSPTGYLHVGGARTALFAWLYARKHNGQFILRIEDTDQERSTQVAVDAILDGMQWLGLNYDEGPFYQMQCMPRYAEVIEQLLVEGKAYRCYCSKERLDQLREQQMANKQKPRYDGCCRDQTDQPLDQPHVIRFKNPTEGSVKFTDLVRGDIEVSNAELDDLIISRTDGTPTYNFTVVVDDVDMNITTVIRGDDHINNTPRQINIMRALGFIPPQYAHVPMILGDDGKRLSKRHGAVSVTQYREDGFLPEALLNYLVRLGWSHGDQEIFSIEQMIEYFDLNQVNHSPAAFNTEKLLWLNQQYMKSAPVDELASWVSKHLNTDKTLNFDELVLTLRERSQTLVELAGKVNAFYQSDVTYHPADADKFLTTDAVPTLQHMATALATINDWNEENIQAVVKSVMKERQLKMPQLAQPLRVALVGSTQSPGISSTIFLVGQTAAIERIEKAIVYCGK